MANNFLEQLVAEWYEYQGYFLRRNVKVGKRTAGGHEGELDVVAFHPVTKHLIHIEPSMDSDNWEKREVRFSRKFEVGRRFIPKLFDGLQVPEKIEQVALFVYASKVNHPMIGGGRVMIASEMISDIVKELKLKPVHASAIPEHLTILRSLQFVTYYKKDVIEALK